MTAAPLYRRQILTGSLLIGFNLVIVGALVVFSKPTIADHFARATAWQYSAQLDKSGVEYLRAVAMDRETLSRNPKDVELRLRIGLAYFQAGLYDKAIEELDQVIQLDPKHRTALLHLASSYYERKDYDQAKTSATRLLELTPLDRKVQLLLGDIALQQKNFKEAAGIYGRDRQKNPRDEAVIRKLIFALAEGREIPKAPERVEIKRVLEETVAWSRDPVFFEWLAQIAEKEGSDFKAFRLREKYYRRYPNNLMFFHNIARFYSQHGFLTDAIRLAEDFLKRNPRSGNAHFIWGLNAYILQDYATAEKQLEQALSLEPKLGAAHFYRGLVHLKKNELDLAYDELNAARDAQFEVPDETIDLLEDRLLIYPKTIRKEK